MTLRESPAQSQFASMMTVAEAIARWLWLAGRDLRKSIRFDSALNVPEILNLKITDKRISSANQTSWSITPAGQVSVNAVPRPVHDKGQMHCFRVAMQDRGGGGWRAAIWHG